MKLAYTLLAVSFLILLSSSIGNASLNVSVSVEYPAIVNLEHQMITATTNEKGTGILLVIQPAEGTPWKDFLDKHPVLKSLWNMLPSRIRTEIAGKIGGKILSFGIISTDIGGGSQTVTFPEDFTGINGEPSTALNGKYKVLFAFLSYESSSELSGIRRCCCLFEVDFDCISWFVVPEVPFGTITPLLASIIALSIFKYTRKTVSNN